jgi:hypothetical protein
MTFSRVEPSEAYRLLRLRSAGGTWELGLNPYVHGIRIRMGRSGRPPGVMDFCAGKNPALAAEVLVAILYALELAPEATGSDDINALFPWGKFRPDLAIHLDALLAPQRRRHLQTIEGSSSLTGTR